MPDLAPSATYPQVMQTADGAIFLFYRAGNHCDDWVLRTSGDGGQTWSAPTAVIDGIAPHDSWYVSFTKGSNDITHVGLCYKDDTNVRKAPGPEFTHRYDVFYMRREPNGDWANAAGARLKLPLSKADAHALCKVYDSTAQRQLTGACPVGADKNGTPYILFRVGGLYGATSYQHKLARFKDKQWEIVDVGPAVESGFVVFGLGQGKVDRGAAIEGIGIVLCEREVPGIELSLLALNSGRSRQKPAQARGTGSPDGTTLILQHKPDCVVDQAVTLGPGSPAIPGEPADAFRGCGPDGT